jgi:hypothetical protein
MRYTLNCQKAKTACVEHILNVDVSKKPIQTVDILPFKKSRTNRQNDYYWSTVIGTVVDYTGYTKEESHELFASAFLSHDTVQIGELKHKRVKSTTKLSTIEFNAYIEEIQQFCSENLGLYIPNANEIFTDATEN